MAWHVCNAITVLTKKKQSILLLFKRVSIKTKQSKNQPKDKRKITSSTVCMHFLRNGKTTETHMNTLTQQDSRYLKNSRFRRLQFHVQQTNIYTFQRPQPLACQSVVVFAICTTDRMVKGKQVCRQTDKHTRLAHS